RLDRGRRVVRVRPTAGIPGPASAAPLSMEEIADARPRRAAGRSQSEDAPDRRVDERADPAVTLPEGFEPPLVGRRVLSKCAEGEDPEGEVRRSRGGPARQVRRR